MKKVLTYILLLFTIYFLTLTNIFAFNEINGKTYEYQSQKRNIKREIDLEKKIKPILKKIIEKKKKELWIYWWYEVLYKFNNKLRTLSEVDNWKIKVLSRIVLDEIRDYEKKYFVDTKNKILYVKDLNFMEIYFNWYKFKIFTTNDKTKTYTYKICEIHNKDNCVKYDNVLFQTNLYLEQIPELKKEQPNLKIYKNKISINNVIWYFDNLKDFIEWRNTESFQKTLLDYNNPDLKYWKDYTKLSNLWIINLDGKKVLGIYEEKDIANVNLNKYNNINKEAIIEAIFEDSKFLWRKITQKDLDKLYKEAIKLKDITTIYNHIKNNVSYNKEVYNQYLETRKVDPKLNYVFTGIWTYENKKAVCSWYTTYLEYLLGFLNYKDIEQQSWYYIDIYSWNLIPHSWLKVWNKYYDITFDDDSEKNTKTFNRYYALPKDLIMIDRVLMNDTETYNKIMSMWREERFKYVYWKYLKYAKNNKYKNYSLMYAYNILNKYNLTIKDFSLNALWKKIDKRYKIKINQDWKLEYIKDYDTNKDISVESLSLAEVINIEMLINIIKQYKLNNIIMAIDEDNKFYVFIKIIK